MTTYCLITVRGGELAGFQPIVGSREQDAVIFSFGMLTERTRNHTRTLASVGVEWVLEEGVREMEALDKPAGRQIGRWKLVGGRVDADLRWFPTD